MLDSRCHEYATVLHLLKTIQMFTCAWQIYKKQTFQTKYSV